MFIVAKRHYAIHTNRYVQYRKAVGQDKAGGMAEVECLRMVC
jgi:hypothetical protein